MTIYYVDSASGSNTSPYDTWAKAATSLTTIDGIDVVGDIIYVASTHAESLLVSLNFAGTTTTPTQIISVDKTSGAPPSTLATGATITWTSNGTITGTVYMNGLSLKCAGNLTFQTGNSFIEDTTLQLTSAGTNTVTVSVGAIWHNVNVKFANAAHSIAATGPLTWNGGILLAGTSPTTLITVSTGRVLCSNLDLLNGATTINLTSSITASAAVDLRSIKLPSNWTGLLNSRSRPQTSKTQGATLINGDYAATNYAYQRWDNYGDVYHETTHVMTGGSSDGTTTLAWKLVSQAHAATFPVSRLECAELTFWNKTIGVARTVTLEYLHDSLTGLKNDEFWIEVDYLGSGSTPIGTMVSSAKADVLQAGATNPSSAAVWNTAGLTNPNAQNVSVTFTPQMVGHFIVRMCLAKASYTVYADRKVTVKG